MKTSPFLPLFLIFALTFFSCDLLFPGEDDEDDNTNLGGAQSPMGEVGTTYTASTWDIEGLDEVQAEVIGLDDGI